MTWSCDRIVVLVDSFKLDVIESYIELAFIEEVAWSRVARVRGREIE